jgi:hypothetical protein
MYYTQDLEHIIIITAIIMMIIIIFINIKQQYITPQGYFNILRYFNLSEVF